MIVPDRIGQSNIEVPLTCGDFCTNSFKQDIKLAFGAMHMHYLGKLFCSKRSCSSIVKLSPFNV